MDDSEGCYSLSRQFIAATSLSCVDFVSRGVDQVTVARVRQPSDGTTLTTELLTGLEFEEYDSEVWRWNGVPE